MTLDRQSFQIRVIAQKKETARREDMQAQLDRLGASFSFLDAYSKPDPQRAAEEGYNAAESLRVMNRELASAEVGCFLSHRAVWREAAQADVPTLVLESDVLLSRETLELTAHLCQRQSLDWGLVMLNYRSCIPSFWGRVRLVHGRRLVKFSNRKTECTATYLISPAAAARLADLSSEFCLTADGFICGGFVDKGIDLRAVFPPAAGFTELADQSYIEAGRASAHSRVSKNKKRTFFRSIGLEVRYFMKKLKPPRKWL